MFDRNILVIDFETSGLDVRIHSPLSLGVSLLSKDLEVVSSDYWLINPKLPYLYTKEAVRFHKIKDFTDHRPRREVLNAFHSLYGQSDVPVIAGWNVAFDVGFLKDLYEEGNLRWPFGYAHLDIQVLGLTLAKGQKTTMDTELKRYGKIYQHHAMRDVEDEIFLFKEYLKQMNLL